MKRFLVFTITLLISFVLIGCNVTSTRNTSLIKNDLTNETWLAKVDSNPNQWLMGADAWFLTGDPNRTERNNYKMYDGMSTSQISVPEFSNIRVDGAFQVQIFGTNDPNTVYVYGPSDAVRQVAVDFSNNVLHVQQLAKISPAKMKQVIVRIGVRNLSKLVQAGCGSIEVIRVRSQALCIESAVGATGDIYLTGNVNLTRVVQRGRGSINIFGANTPELDIEAAGWGAINICGNVGVRCIIHKGWGDVNIIGANTNGLIVNAEGRGKIGIRGYVNIKEIKARDNTCVYICTSTSNSIYASIAGNAQVGISGYTNDLTVTACDNARFYGRLLCAQNAFVRARDWAHINMVASDKTFVTAIQNSSIYFYGTPNNLSQFVSENGVFFPIWTGTPNRCLIQRPSMPATVYSAPIYKDMPVFAPRSAMKYRWVNRRLRAY